MSTIKTITLPDCSQAKAREVVFNLEHEDWSVYNLPEDGTVVKLKTTVLKILQVLDNEGKPQGLNNKFERDKNYALIIKAPGTLARKVEFRTSGGTTVLDPISFPVGDIAPASAPDGKINALDRSLLVSQWNASSDVAKTGDFNGDSRINSLDYACMRINFKDSDQTYSPPAFASPTPTPIPTASPTPSPTPGAAGLSI